MSPYYRITLPVRSSSTLTVRYHDSTFPVAQYHVVEKRHEVFVPRGGEVRIVPGNEFLVEAVYEGAEPVATDPVSSIKSPPG